MPNKLRNFALGALAALGVLLSTSCVVSSSGTGNAGGQDAGNVTRADADRTAGAKAGRLAKKVVTGDKGPAPRAPPCGGPERDAGRDGGDGVHSDGDGDLCRLHR